MIGSSPTQKALHEALYSVQGDIHGVVKNSKNPHFKNRYANLEAVIDAIKPHLQRAGLVFSQFVGEYSEENGQVVTTMIAHPESGEWLTFRSSAPLAKKDPQGAMSVVTYLCRYGLMGAFGIPPVDDDAETAVRRDTIDDLIVEMKKCTTEQQLAQWGLDNADRIQEASGVKARLKEQYKLLKETFNG